MSHFILHVLIPTKVTPLHHSASVGPPRTKIHQRFSSVCKAEKNI